ncbi:MAG: hypothetical protein D6742_18905 [Cyanobacteria bacterium J069]|nr:MAG: hypothetical protein D6742_18905 [Cyanobacteria bacterium J069]
MASSFGGDSLLSAPWLNGIEQLWLADDLVPQPTNAAKAMSRSVSAGWQGCIHSRGDRNIGRFIFLAR